jgi:hypothetical protein
VRGSRAKCGSLFLFAEKGNFERESGRGIFVAVKNQEKCSLEKRMLKIGVVRRRIVFLREKYARRHNKSGMPSRR